MKHYSRILRDPDALKWSQKSADALSFRGKMKDIPKSLIADFATNRQNFDAHVLSFDLLHCTLSVWQYRPVT